MSEMIERVARAIYAARYVGDYEPMPWVTNAARAAIDAMRNDAADAWVAMIDAALAEGVV